ncbi:MAG: hypothetical protein ACI8RZ_000163 [Myxococcota bacterium]
MTVAKAQPREGSGDNGLSSLSHTLGTTGLRCHRRAGDSLRRPTSAEQPGEPEKSEGPCRPGSTTAGAVLALAGVRRLVGIEHPGVNLARVRHPGVITALVGLTVAVVVDAVTVLHLQVFIPATAAAITPLTTPTEAGWLVGMTGPEVGAGVVLSEVWSVMAGVSAQGSWLDLSGDGAAAVVPWWTGSVGVELSF